MLKTIKELVDSWDGTFSSADQIMWRLVELLEGAKEVRCTGLVLKDHNGNVFYDAIRDAGTAVEARITEGLKNV
jgi:hypothetical protein